MKKLIAMLAATLFAVPLAWGQETVTGTVVDRKGKPLPGVKVEIPGSTDFTISDLDGTFKITPYSAKDKKAQFSYAGMNSRKKKLKGGMKVKMKEYNWWSQHPDEWSWFANAMVAIPTVDKPITPAYGLMVGRVKKWGFYVKGVTNTFGVNATGTFDNYGDYYEGYGPFQGFPVDCKNRYWSVTGGFIFRLWSPIHFYAGAGYSDFSYLVQNGKGEWFKDRAYSQADASIDWGFMIRLNRVTVTAGYNVGYGDDYYENYGRCAGNFGIGYTF